ncbi:hypothetical protein N7466_010423 [Penicillium verhagenii]|uniref:uncharacterized protein n=1 Tax=Penicillium verhagenii TaxID=1562060 RepID=UPI0025455067|nr:uncharacterized protein N7466_010423 [Penicillium verhagenii]KAJ5918431.1 hypothetical protein N7466_010423 [Penicillium verhagenii]
MTCNIYSAEPAHPVLAHSLLSEPRPTTIDQPIHGPTTNDWDLKDDWTTGLGVSKDGVFRSGTIIGFSRLRNRSSDSDEYVGQLPRYLLTEYLRKNPPSSEANTFIIYPSFSDAFAARTLLTSLQSGPSPLSREDAMKRLDCVQLYPVQNLPDAAQAIKQVSELLQQAEENRQLSDQAASPIYPAIILVVVGLDTLAEGIIRTSNTARGSAVLASTLRALTRMSRTHGSLLSILLVNTSGLGSSPFDAGQDTSSGRAAMIGSGENDTRPSNHDGIHSIFQLPGSQVLSTLLMRTLDQGIDTHILLSDVKYARVAEVIKDRTGTGLGKWGIWSPPR